MENKLVLKDGTEIKNGFASKSSRNQLMIRIPGNDLVNAAIQFGDPNKTEEIVCYYSIYKTTYIGFTIMYTIQYFADDDYVELWLKPAEDVTATTEQEIIVPKEYIPYEVGNGEEEVADGSEGNDTTGEN